MIRTYSTSAKRPSGFQGLSGNSVKTSSFGALPKRIDFLKYAGGSRGRKYVLVHLDIVSDGICKPNNSAKFRSSILKL